MPILHGVAASPFVRKVRIALAEKAVEYELEAVMPGQASEAFRKLSPLGKVPVWQDGDYVLPDSSAICAYLERLHPEPALFPAEAKALGQALWFEEYADTRMIEVLMPIFIQRVLNKKIFKQDCDEALVAVHLEELAPVVYDYLEGRAPDEGFWVEGRFGIADLSMASPFVSILHAGVEVDGGRWPRLRAWLDRVFARPKVAAIIEEEKAGFAAL